MEMQVGLILEVILLSLAVMVMLSLYLFLIYRLLRRKSFYNIKYIIICHWWVWLRLLQPEKPIWEALRGKS